MICCSDAQSMLLFFFLWGRVIIVKQKKSISKHRASSGRLPRPFLAHNRNPKRSPQHGMHLESLVYTRGFAFCRMVIAFGCSQSRFRLGDAHIRLLTLFKSNFVANLADLHQMRSWLCRKWGFWTHTIK